MKIVFHKPVVHSSERGRRRAGDRGKLMLKECFEKQPNISPRKIILLSEEIQSQSVLLRPNMRPRRSDGCIVLFARHGACVRGRYFHMTEERHHVCG